MAGTLIVCSTPIGNLGDAPPRLAEALGSADVVYAEDTRRTGILLRSLGVAVPVRSYFTGNEETRSVELAERLRRGETVALVTDAGTPAISDPGLTAVRAAERVRATVTVIPGPSAVTAALAGSGLPSDRFVFEGFLPRRAGERSARLEALRDEPRTIVLFSAPSRVGADLADLAAALGTGRRVVVAREMTKMFEEFWRGELGEATAHWTAAEARGEFTLVVEGAAPSPPDIDVEAAVDLVEAAMASGTPFADAVRGVAGDLGMRRRRLYEAALFRRKGVD